MPVTELASVDGVIAPTAEASIPVQDDGLYRGDGVFEVIRLYRGRPFALGDHLDRLERSAAAIELPAQRAELAPEIEALLEAHGDADAQLRLVVTRGGRRIALIEPLVEHLESVRLATVTYAPTLILNGVKSLSYGANMQATRIAKGGGADEALLVRPDGIVLEAPTSTIFWVSGGELRTPALRAGILDSITRRTVAELLDVAEGEYEIGNLLDASEIFLASTVREIQPVAAIDDTAFETGPRTAEAQEAFANSVAEALGTAA
ncbi:MAG: branched-chain amino acid aminotransferase [Solirubrobacterales bacterium]|jgi:branched-chain amino acid aminotransferase|nr:branched-chain amino acid aminotransferase [Solirubrobacterales bacterium]